ncbi:hypothetical protein VP01_219g5 [Puccinia sorghi]|uniref:Uncharacterized protein n=1 Tax=Puccinia sorghi TaxID=27349 RepID=A0A0L6V968_9BASI|nr:hypothetical protein VP01_219g5 [Puccinia sorghi]
MYKASFSSFISQSNNLFVFFFLGPRRAATAPAIGAPLHHSHVAPTTTQLVLNETTLHVSQVRGYFTRIKSDQLAHCVVVGSTFGTCRNCAPDFLRAPVDTTGMISVLAWRPLCNISLIQRQITNRADEGADRQMIRNFYKGGTSCHNWVIRESGDGLQHGTGLCNNLQELPLYKAINPAARKESCTTRGRNWRRRLLVTTMAGKPLEFYSRWGSILTVGLHVLSLTFASRRAPTEQTHEPWINQKPISPVFCQINILPGFVFGNKNQLYISSFKLAFQKMNLLMQQPHSRYVLSSKLDPLILLTHRRTQYSFASLLLRPFPPYPLFFCTNSFWRFFIFNFATQMGTTARKGTENVKEHMGAAVRAQQLNNPCYCGDCRRPVLKIIKPIGKIARQGSFGALGNN